MAVCRFGIITGDLYNENSVLYKSMALFGGAVFGFSLYPLVDFWFNEYVQSSEKLNKYRTACYIFVAGGAFVVIYSIVGIYGGAKPKYKCPLFTYITCLTLSILLMIGGAVWCYVNRQEIKIEIQNSQVLTEVLKRDYGKEQRITRAFDFMQVELLCCGGVGFEDYKGSDWISALKYQDRYADEVNIQLENAVPLTCCSDYRRYQNTPNPEYQYCVMYTDAYQGGPQPTVGCGKAIVDLFIEYMGVAAGLGIGTLCWMILGIVLAGLLIRKMRNLRYLEEKSWHEMSRRSRGNTPHSSRASSYDHIYR
ncbi:hypothetical protein FSP39_013108 [Pinctada imbricata]|uniref:Tetraspanin n=1 Tax=Pinctada imbricata TaxID=66713 RepID=A0AA88YMU2_PINIB|nr:hypothetical protein FSP39_013108 [Pinctada imbricata]